MPRHGGAVLLPQCSRKRTAAYSPSIFASTAIRAKSAFLRLPVGCHSLIPHVYVEVAAALHRVHDDAALLQPRHERLVDAQIKGVAALQQLHVRHRPGAVQVDSVSLVQALHFGVRHQLQASLLRLSGHHRVHLSRERNHIHGHVAEQRQAPEQRADVAMFEPADHRHPAPVDAPQFPVQRVQVRQGLRGVIVQAASVDDGDRVRGFSAFDDPLVAGAKHHDVDVQARQDGDDVVDVVWRAHREKLRGVLGAVGLATQEPDRPLEGGSREEARLVKERVQGVTAQGRGGPGRLPQLVGEAKDLLFDPRPFELGRAGQMMMVRHDSLEWRRLTIARRGPRCTIARRGPPPVSRPSLGG